MCVDRLNLSCFRQVAVVTTLLCTPVATLAGSYTEDFTSTTYMDPANTTANWDTTAGALELFPFEPSAVGELILEEQAWGLDVDGDLLYLADLTAGLQIVDISDPTAPAFLGNYWEPGIEIVDVMVDGNWAYLADAAGYLRVIDVTDPTNPASVGAFSYGGDVGGVFVSGDHVYLGASTSLWTVDVSDPSTPTPVGSVWLSGTAQDVWVEGDIAYVASSTQTGGLHVVDITAPASPSLLATYVPTRDASAVCVSGNTAYVADGDGGLLVLDVSDPSSPSLIGSYATPSAAIEVDVVGDRAYVAASSSGLHVLDITHPEDPVLMFSLATSDEAHAVVVDGVHAYAAVNYESLQVFEIDVIGAPEIVGSVDLLAGALSLAGDHAYVASQIAFEVIDIRDAAHPAIVGSVSMNGIDLDVAGDHAYVAGHSGLQVIDIGDPTVPVIVGSLAINSYVWTVAVAGNEAFVTSFTEGVDRDSIHVVDITDPTNPFIVGSVFVGGGAAVEAIAGDHAYAGYGVPGLHVVNISDPTSMYVEGFVALPTWPRQIVVSGDHAYAPCDHQGLHVIDISDPTDPSVVGVAAAGPYTSSVWIAGNHAYVASRYVDPVMGGLQVLDVSDPTNPFAVGSLELTMSWMTDGDVAGDRVYLTDSVGMRVISTATTVLDVTRNRARSLTLSSSEGIARCRFTTTETDSITWEVSQNGGLEWSPLLSGAGWLRFGSVGSDLRWRATLSDLSDPPGPSCSLLQLDWLLEAADIDSIVDVPDDQGSRVMLHFARSTYDFADEPDFPIATYNIWQRVDDAGGRAAILSDGEPYLAEETDGGPSLLEWRGGRYAIGSSNREVGELPPGVWAVIGSFAAAQQDQYLYRADTVADSTEAGVEWSVYCVSAHSTTPSVWYASEPDSGYSIDNLAPLPPMNLVFDSPEIIAWDPPEEEDFAYHTAYGSYRSILDESATVLGVTVDPTFDISGTAFGYYHVTTADHAGNDSEAGSVTNPFVSTPEIDALPQVFAVRGASPNPARSMTSFALALPEASRVTATVFDAAGARVRSLGVGDRYPAGHHRVRWDGRDDGGHRVGTGIYFLRVSMVGDGGSTLEQSRKVVWIR